MPGFPKKLLHSSSEKYLCQKCHDILREPVQTPCGHRYCKQCFEEILGDRDDTENNQLCIACQDEGVLDSFISLDEMYKDRAIRRELNEQKVRCINEKCDWTGLFKEYWNHVNNCPFEMISCIKRGCNVTFPREKLSEHLEKDCPMRVFACPHCDEEITLADQEDHFSQCPGYPVPCQFCEKTVSRQQIKGHVDPEKGDCERTIDFCEFWNIGCKEMVPMIMR